MLSKIFLSAVFSMLLLGAGAQAMAANLPPLPEHNDLGNDSGATQAIQQSFNGYVCALTRHPYQGPYYVGFGPTEPDAIQSAQAKSLAVDGYSNNYVCYTVQQFVGQTN